MSENDGKIHTVYMRDPLKIKSQNLPYKKTDLYGRIWRGFPGPCRGISSTGDFWGPDGGVARLGVDEDKPKAV